MLECAIVRIMLSTICEETTVWVALNKYIWLNSTFLKAMNKIESTNERVFISLVGPSGSGKSLFIFDWLKIGTFQPTIKKFFFFYQHYQPVYGQMQRKTTNLFKE